MTRIVLTVALLVLASLAPARAQVGKATQARPQPAAPDDRAADRAAIRAAMQSFAKSFESGDAKALAAHWTDEGEYQGESAGTIRGRKALEAGFTAFFAKNPK